MQKSLASRGDSRGVYLDRRKDRCRLTRGPRSSRGRPGRTRDPPPSRRRGKGEGGATAAWGREQTRTVRPGKGGQCPPGTRVGSRGSSTWRHMQTVTKVLQGLIESFPGTTCLRPEPQRRRGRERRPRPRQPPSHYRVGRAKALKGFAPGDVRLKRERALPAVGAPGTTVGVRPDFSHGAHEKKGRAHPGTFLGNDSGHRPDSGTVRPVCKNFFLRLSGLHFNVDGTLIHLTSSVSDLLGLGSEPFPAGGRSRLNAETTSGPSRARPGPGGDGPEGVGSDGSSPPVTYANLSVELT